MHTKDTASLSTKKTGLAHFLSDAHFSPRWQVSLGAWIYTVFKWGLFLFSVVYLYLYILADSHFKEILSLSGHHLISAYGVCLLVACLLLIVVNWGLEAYKWQSLVAKFHKISPPQAFMAVLAGNAVSMWMPNRMGEYVGRVIVLKPKARLKGALATLIGSVSQLMATLIAGTAGLVYYLNSRMPSGLWTGIVLSGLLFIGLLFFFYFNIYNIRQFVPAKPWAKPLRRYLLVYRLYGKKELEKILLYSFCRYLVFSTQFYLLLLFLDIQVPVLEAFGSIFLMFLLQTISPTSGFTEVVVRGSTTAMLFSAYTHNVMLVVAASYILWLINIVLPGVAGLVILLLHKMNNRIAAK